MHKAIRRLPAPALSRLALAFGAILLLDFLVVILYGRLAATRPADVAVVLGNEVHPDGQPSARLRARLQRALELYEQGKCRAIIVSGGQAVHGLDESTVMGDWLVAEGVPETTIIRDPKGLNSRLTAQNSVGIMADHGYTSAIVVSQYWHLPRTLLAFHQAGIRNVSSAWPRYNELRDLYSIPREMIGLPVYLLRLK